MIPKREDNVEQILFQAAKSTINTWLKIEKSEKLTIFSDSKRLELSNKIHDYAISQEIKTDLIFLNTLTDSHKKEISDYFSKSSPHDVLINNFSWDFYSENKLFEYFPTFSVPRTFKGRSATIRSRIPTQALYQGLTTDHQLIQPVLEKYLKIKTQSSIRVMSSVGTDLTFNISPFQFLNFSAHKAGEHAFLPPAEVYGAIVEGSANGKIVIDMTIGEFVYKGEMWENFGLVDQPLTLQIQEGVITSITGSSFSDRLKECFSRVEESCKMLVELGIGLSSIVKTGHIGADECMLNTCHFGFGDNQFYGGVNKAPIHLDMVISNPKIEVKDREIETK